MTAVWCLSGTANFCALAVADEPIPVITQPLSELVIYPESSAAAQVISLNDTAVAAQVEGVIEAVQVRVGDAVKAGAVVATLACQDHELERERLLAELQAQQAKLELASWQVKQTGLLADRRTVPQEKLKEKLAELATIKAEINAQQVKIKTAVRQVAHCTVKAPYAGVVTKREVSVGQYVGRGAALVHLLDLVQAEVSAQVASADLNGLSAAGVQDFEHEGQRYPLKLRSVLPAIQAQTGTQEVRLDFSGNRARPGAAGKLVWRDRQPHLAAEHLIKRGENLGLFIETQGKAHFHPLPNAQDGRPTLLDLPPATAIIVTGQYSLTEGMALTVQVQSKSIERDGSAADLAHPANPAKNP